MLNFVEENILKKVVAIFVALSILISTLSLTPAFADETKRMQSSNRQVIIVQQKEKKESLFSKISIKFKNLVFKLNLTAFYYYLVTIGLVSLFDKLEIFNSEKVYSKFKFGDFLSSIWLNAKSFPGCIKLIYDKIKNLTDNQNINKQENNSKSKTQEKSATVETICDLIQKNISGSNLSEEELGILKNANSIENLTCSISNVINSMKTMNDEQKFKFLKIIEVAGNLGLDKLWKYLKTHGTLIWTGSTIGSIVGLFGSMVGAFNFGWLYGMFMIPYLWSLKDKSKGDLEILVNGVNFTYKIYNNTFNFFNKKFDYNNSTSLIDMANTTAMTNTTDMTDMINITNNNTTI